MSDAGGACFEFKWDNTMTVTDATGPSASVSGPGVETLPLCSVWNAGFMVGSNGRLNRVTAVGQGRISIASPMILGCGEWYQRSYTDPNSVPHPVTYPFGAHGSSTVDTVVLVPCLVLTQADDNDLEAFSSFGGNFELHGDIRNTDPSGIFSWGNQGGSLSRTLRQEGALRFGSCGQISGVLMPFSSGAGRYIKSGQSQEQMWSRAQSVTDMPFPLSGKLETTDSGSVATITGTLDSGSLTFGGGSGGETIRFTRYNPTAARMLDNPSGTDIPLRTGAGDIIGVSDIQSSGRIIPGAPPTFYSIYRSPLDDVIYSTVIPFSEYMPIVLDPDGNLDYSMRTFTDITKDGWSAGLYNTRCNYGGVGVTGTMTPVSPTAVTDSSPQLSWMEFWISYGHRSFHRESPAFTFTPDPDPTKNDLPGGPIIGVAQFPPPSIVASHSDGAIEIEVQFEWINPGFYPQLGVADSYQNTYAANGVFNFCSHAVGFMDNFVDISTGLAVLVRNPPTQPAFYPLFIGQSTVPLELPLEETVQATGRVIVKKSHTVANPLKYRWVGTTIYYTACPVEQVQPLDPGGYPVSPAGFSAIGVSSVSVTYKDVWGAAPNVCSALLVTPGTSQRSTLGVTGTFSGNGALTVDNAKDNVLFALRT